MNIQNLISNFTQNPNEQANSDASKSSSPLDALSQMIPGGLAGGVAAGGIMALFMGSKSTRKVAGNVAKLGGTAVIGGLAYKAYNNWQGNKALSQTEAITNDDIDLASKSIPLQLSTDQASGNTQSLDIILINTMIAASKADGNIDSLEHQRLFAAIEKFNLEPQDKAAVFDAMAREVTVQEIAGSVSRDEHKAEVYLAAYLAIEVDNELERTFLNDLAYALELPEGFPSYLEQQARQGIAA